MKWGVRVLALVGALAVLAAFIGFLYLMIPAGHAKPFVTMEPEDQKQELGLYDDAEGPPWHDIPIVGGMNPGWGMCYKPGVKLGEDEHGNGIYAEDHEVIWRCMQTHPTGETIPPSEAPVVYCFVQNPLVIQKTDQVYYACYHNYGDIFLMYEAQWGKSPLILPDEVEYVPTTEIRDP